MPESAHTPVLDVVDVVMTTGTLPVSPAKCFCNASNSSAVLTSCMFAPAASAQVQSVNVSKGELMSKADARCFSACEGSAC